MYQITRCPACDNPDVEIKSGAMARFVVWQSTGTDPGKNIPVNALVCHNCSFVCSGMRLDTIEENNLYKDYRGPLYNQRRVICEPNYVNFVKQDYFEDQGYYDARSIGIDQLLHRNILIETIQSVLDYGGDTGSHIPVYLNHAKKYVLEISGIDLVPGVEKYSRQTGPEHPDLIMCCHVIEHVSDLDTFITDIKSFMTKNSWLYLEMPCYDSPIVTERFHEHINTWNLRSATAFLQRHNMTVIDSVQFYSDYFQGNNICILTKLG